MKKLIFITTLCFIAIIVSSSVFSAEQKEMAPDFSLANLDGTKVNLSDFANKKSVLLVFWATWCPFCVEELPELNKLADEKKDKLQILAVNLKEDAAKVSSFAKKRGAKYTILLDSTGEIAQKYNVRGIPTNVLIGKDGSILYNGHSLDECEELIKKLP